MEGAFAPKSISLPVSPIHNDIVLNKLPEPLTNSAFKHSLVNASIVVVASSLPLFGTPMYGPLVIDLYKMLDRGQI